MLKGHCQCQAVRYETTGSPDLQSICHCTICRRTSGAPLVGWFTVPVASFRLVSGSPTSFRSSDLATRTFCGACGTPLTFHSTRYPDVIDITTCSLEDPELVPPQDHIFVRSKLSWMKLADGLPTYAASRPD